PMSRARVTSNLRWPSELHLARQYARPRRAAARHDGVSTRASRGLAGRGRAVEVLGAQDMLLDLANRRARQVGMELHCLRDAKARQARRAPGDQLVGGGRVFGFQHNAGMDRLVPDGIGNPDHRRVEYRWMIL